MQKLTTKQFKFFLYFFCSVLSIHLSAQELNCRVVINAQQVQTTERRIFEEMEVAFSQFMNNRKWTEDDFEEHERIDCNIIMTLAGESDLSVGRYVGSVQILASRPVYGTDYQSILLNFGDQDWTFEYQQAQPLQFNENSFTNNITSLLAYYAYMILGLDYDSFSELGGTDYFRLAKMVVTNAENSNYAGWNQYSGKQRNRYAFNENILNATFEEMRKGFYRYHRLALDQFNEDPDAAREEVLGLLRAMNAASKSRPRSIFVLSFLDAKATELTQILKEGTPPQKKEAFTILKTLDPGRTETFKEFLD